MLGQPGTLQRADRATRGPGSWTVSPEAPGHHPPWGCDCIDVSSVDHGIAGLPNRLLASRSEDRLRRLSRHHVDASPMTLPCAPRSVPHAVRADHRSPPAPGRLAVASRCLTTCRPPPVSPPGFHRASLHRPPSGATVTPRARPGERTPVDDPHRPAASRSSSPSHSRHHVARETTPCPHPASAAAVASGMMPQPHATSPRRCRPTSRSPPGGRPTPMLRNGGPSFATGCG
jgi:hypothetical protein